MEPLAMRIKEKYEKIISHHQKKDIESLKNTLRELEEEHDKVKEDLDTVDYLLSLLERHGDAGEGGSGEVTAPGHFASWARRLRKELEKIHLKEAEELTPGEKELIRSERPRLRSEHRRLEEERNYLDGLIAHSKVLLLDLQEKYCATLTNGYDITQTAQKLKDHFGSKLETISYYGGRDQIIRFLEETFSLNRITSKKLFDLLEDTEVLKFRIDTSLMAPVYYDFDGTEANNFSWGQPLLGTWLIRA